MSVVFTVALTLLVSYLLGCFNGSVMTSHFIIRDDVRQHGSGNAGLTNFYRTYGARYALCVIICDMGKTVLACLIGAALGSVNGLVITYGKVAPFIATLATMTIFRGLTLVYTNGNPISSLSEDDRFLEFGQGYVAGLPVPAIMMLIMFFILWFILHKTPLGRKTYAVGGNEKVSFIAGIKINRIKIFAYTVTGFLCGMAGAILTSRLNSAQPTAGTGYELDAIAAVVLGGTSLSGGKGRIFGTIIGALIIGTLNNGLNILNVSSFYQQVVKGIVILLAVLMDRKKN